MKRYIIKKLESFDKNTEILNKPFRLKVPPRVGICLWCAFDDGTWYHSPYSIKTLTQTENGYIISTRESYTYYVEEQKQEKSKTFKENSLF